jgi:transposase-like protein
MDTKKQHELLDDLLKDYVPPRDILGLNGYLKQLTKSLVERALVGEMSEHLGYKNTGGTTQERTAIQHKQEDDLKILLPVLTILLIINQLQL